MARSVERLELSQTRTAFDERGAAYTLYEIRVSDGSAAWATEKRFSDFKRLAAALDQRHRKHEASSRPPPMPIPPGILSAGWVVGGNMEPDFVRKRAYGLQGWLLALNGELRHDDPIWCEFLAIRRPRRSNPPAPAPAPTAAAAGGGAAGAEAGSPARGSVAASPTGARSAAAAAVAAGGDARDASGEELVWEVVWEAPEEEAADLPPHPHSRSRLSFGGVGRSVSEEADVYPHPHPNPRLNPPSPSQLSPSTRAAAATSPAAASPGMLPGVQPAAASPVGGAAAVSAAVQPGAQPSGGKSGGQAGRQATDGRSGAGAACSHAAAAESGLGSGLGSSPAERASAAEVRAEALHEKALGLESEVNRLRALLGMAPLEEGHRLDPRLDPRVPAAAAGPGACATPGVTPNGRRLSIGERVWSRPPSDAQPVSASGRTAVLEEAVGGGGGSEGWVAGRVVDERTSTRGEQVKVSLDGYDSDADRWVAASPEESGDAHGGGGGGGEGASPAAEDRVRRMEEGEEGDAGFVDGSEPSSTSSDGIEGDVKTSQA